MATLDWIVIAAYLAAMLLLAVWLGRSQSSRSYKGNYPRGKICHFWSGENDDIAVDGNFVGFCFGGELKPTITVFIFKGQQSGIFPFICPVQFTHFFDGLIMESTD